MILFVSIIREEEHCHHESRAAAYIIYAITRCQHWHTSVHAGYVRMMYVGRPSTRGGSPLLLGMHPFYPQILRVPKHLCLLVCATPLLRTELL